MYDARTKLSEEVAREVRNHFADKVFSTIIPRSVRLSEAPSYGQPAIVYEPSSRGSRAYVWLAEEFDHRFPGDRRTEPPSDTRTRSKVAPGARRRSSSGLSQRPRAKCAEGEGIA